MKKLLKNFLQTSNVSIIKKLFFVLKKIKLYFAFRRVYNNDMKRYIKYSRTFEIDCQDKMLGSIIHHYHVIEKGLTMPSTRSGFGKEMLISLCRECLVFIEQYGQIDEQLNHAIGVILEYEAYHESLHYSLDNDVIGSIKQLKNLIQAGVEKTLQTKTTKSEFFKYKNSSFHEFSNSRLSLRNYSETELPLMNIINALELARNAPSACNRQSWRTYVYTNRQKIDTLLEAQGGNRGFGHLANKLIIITGELGLFYSTFERYQVYIDGGIYAMNLLYALHHKEIAACILNCSFDYEKEEEIKNLAGIKDSEVLIAMVACGIAPGEFKVANSPRYSLNKTNTIFE